MPTSEEFVAEFEDEFPSKWCEPRPHHEWSRNLLDHGYIKVVDSWGSDQSIIEAARMSTGKGFLGWNPGDCPTCDGKGSVVAELYDAEEIPFSETCTTCEGKGKIKGDASLLSYLYKNNHATPFEMAGVIFEVQAPIFVFREWHRHRTQGYNEMSARYAPLPDINYIPTLERIMRGGGHLTKQAASSDGAEVLTEEAAEEFRKSLEVMYSVQEEFYRAALKRGIPKELARIDLPVGRYSRMRCTTNLRNWLAFMTLRSDVKAQEEIRVYSEAIGDYLSLRFPRTMKLFNARNEPVKPTFEIVQTFEASEPDAVARAFSKAVGDTMRENGALKPVRLGPKVYRVEFEGTLEFYIATSSYDAFGYFLAHHDAPNDPTQEQRERFHRVATAFVLMPDDQSFVRRDEGTGQIQSHTFSEWTRVAPEGFLGRAEF